MASRPRRTAWGGGHGGVHGPSSSSLNLTDTVTRGVYVPVMDRGVVRGGEQRSAPALGYGTSVTGSRGGEDGKCRLGSNLAAGQG